ncbi:Peroxisome chaperone and import receptor [Elasticomyces elasticus]|nr:Peroxisome chaperone and import receptor [Elasticomyces elasticus]KAK3655810.1 Peroxisome chaperone and import receptor [Elasticomyces elasticus]KAK4925851.1 Peroxisome chaperone and import receptor [Elasticomyces elasticus]KAK5764805.1 Peroxisome chaperone and import receptor [Elasticomyces elasticus]
MAQPHDQATHAPDPDEDDLDDLDDVLDEFQPTPAAKPPAQPSQPPPTLSGPGRPPTSSDNASFPDANEEALAAQLQAGMADLMSELDSNPDMQKQFEQMMSELIAVGSAPSDAEAEKHLKAAVDGLPKMPEEEEEPEPEPEPATATAGSSGKTNPTKPGKKTGSEEDAFSSTIRKTMARMQASDSTASASATTTSSEPSNSEEDMLAQMMRELQSSSGGAGGEGGEEGDFNTMLMNMMTQLTNKEILYEPMKELHDKFPAWMERHKNDGSVGKEDMARYVEQQVLVGEIVGRFERKGYTDENEGDREFIVERMQKMQSAGSPPPDLVGDMSAAQEALGDLDQGCPTQ